jgi:hypothetical protein
LSALQIRPFGAVLILKEIAMIGAIATKPYPLAAILVYGCPTSPDLPQASWFRAEDKAAARVAAAELRFSIIELQSEAEKALAAGVGEGVLKGSGRMIVGSVSKDVYNRIEEYARQGANSANPSRPEIAAATTKPASEQTTNIGAPEPPHASIGAPVPATGKPDSAVPRETLRVRALNDAFRRTFVGGMVMITVGVEAMPIEQRRSLLEKVRAFDAFTEDNDPHGEHDFGAIEEGGVRYFWKVDCYDRATEFGSPDPADPAVTTRVLTVMLAGEY